MGEEYGIYVDEVAITKDNEDDVLGDGTVYYDEYNNIFGVQIISALLFCGFNDEKQCSINFVNNLC